MIKVKENLSLPDVYHDDTGRARQHDTEVERHCLRSDESPEPIVPPLVSVIIPTHNRATLLKEALDSVFSQEDRDVQFRLEVIVVDDASSDETPVIAGNFQTVRYLRLNRNSGPSVARNTGLAVSTGQYIAFLDDDDVWLPHHLKLQVPVLEQYREIGVVYGQGWVKNLNGLHVLWPEGGPSGWIFEELITRTEDFINVDTLLVRREAIDRVGPFDEMIETMEHYEFALRLARLYQWHFITGPIARGREFKLGKYNQDVVSGALERTLPVIIDKAIRLLPDSANREIVRRRAETAVCATIVGHRWQHGAGIESVRTFLLAQLQIHPWLAEEPAIRQHIRKLIRGLAVSSLNPLVAVRLFWKDLCGVLRPEAQTSFYPWRMVLTEAVEALREDSSAPFRAAALVLHGSYAYPLRWDWRLVRVLINACLLLVTRPFRLLLRGCGIMKPEERWTTLLAELGRTSDVFFVVIGAMDGQTYDPLYPSIIQHRWQGLMVEPLPDLFAELCETYRGLGGIHFENVAIADHCGITTMVRVKPSAVDLGLVPPWAKGISSFFEDRNALGGQRIDKEDFEKIRSHIIREQVACETLGNILQKHAVTKIDVLQIDVEGYDYHVLKQLDFTRFRPKVIRMEWYNLPDKEKQQAKFLLRRWDYSTVELGFDLIAWTKS